MFCDEDLLYADDLVLMVLTMEQLGTCVAEWSASFLDKGFKVNWVDGPLHS